MPGAQQPECQNVLHGTLVNSGRFASKPDNSNQGPVVKHYSTRRSLGLSMSLSEGSSSSTGKSSKPKPYRARHTAVAAFRAARQSTIESPTSSAADGGIPARDTRWRNPPGSGFLANGPSPPTIASASKYRARPRPD